MVRNYKRKSDKGLTPEDSIQIALQDIIENGSSIRDAAINFNIKKSTLYDRLKAYRRNHMTANDSGVEDEIVPAEALPNVATKYATRTVFNETEENELEQYLLQCSSYHYGLGYKTTRQLAYQYANCLKKKYPAAWDRNLMAGEDWLYSFMKRHPKLSLRKPENTSLARVNAFNKETVETFFRNYKVVLRRATGQYTPDRIINIDESGISTVLQAPKVIAERGKKQVGQVTSGERGTLVTFIGIICASGATIPPVYIFPRKRLKEEYLRGAPAGSICFGSDSGWSNADIFLKVLHHIKKYTHCCKDNPLLIIADNHESHIKLPVIIFCRENGVTLVTFPPHCTHRMQPLDTGLFSPFKARLKTSFDDYLLSNPGSVIKIDLIPRLSAQPYYNSFTPLNIIRAFEKTGIWPVNSEIYENIYIAPPKTINQDDPVTSQAISVSEYREAGSVQFIGNILDEILANVVQINVNSKIRILDIRPLPNIQCKNITKRNSEPGSSKIYTDSPEKEKIEEREKKKQLKLQKQVKQVKKHLSIRAETVGELISQSKIIEKKETVKLLAPQKEETQPAGNQSLLRNVNRVQQKKEKGVKNRKRSHKEYDLSSSESEALSSAKTHKYCDSSDSDIAMMESEEEILPYCVDDTILSPDDYVLVQFPTKKTIKYYVGQISSILSENEFEVSCYRKTKSDGFVLPHVPDVSSVLKQDIVLKLPKPLEIRGTSRMQSCMRFSINLNTFNLQ